MKKSHPFTELSDKKCKCGKKLKARLVKDKHPSNIKKCYKCYSVVRYANILPKLDFTQKVIVSRQCVASDRDSVRL